MAYENFNAASAEFTIKGVNVHPGEAKDIMVNAALVGCEIAAALPANETPATTEGREGFYHLCDMSGDVASAICHILCATTTRLFLLKDLILSALLR